MTNLIMERTTKNKFKGVDVDVQSWGHLLSDGPNARWSKHQACCLKYQTPTSMRTPVQDVREAIAKLDNIAQKYMSTNAEEFVHIVVGEPEHEGEPWQSPREPCTSFRESCSSVERYAKHRTRAWATDYTSYMCNWSVDRHARVLRSHA